MKFKVGDKVKTHFGEQGEIVFIDEGSTQRYLVKIKDFEGHDGNSGCGYVSQDGLNDKWWFVEWFLELLIEEE